MNVGGRIFPCIGRRWYCWYARIIAFCSSRACVHLMGWAIRRWYPICGGRGLAGRGHLCLRTFSKRSLCLREAIVRFPSCPMPHCRALLLRRRGCPNPLHPALPPIDEKAGRRASRVIYGFTSRRAGREPSTAHQHFHPALRPCRASGVADCLSLAPAVAIHRTMFRTSLRRTLSTALASPARPSSLPATPLVRRTYAEAAKSETLKLSFSVPHQSIYANKEVYSLFLSIGPTEPDFGAGSRLISLQRRGIWVFFLTTFRLFLNFDLVSLKSFPRGQVVTSGLVRSPSTSQLERFSANTCPKIGC